MNNPNHPSIKNFLRHPRGSTLVVVMVLSIVLGFILVAIMGRGQSEQRLTDRNTRFHEALNAAESIGNYGMAEVVSRYTSRAYLPPDEFSSNKLKIPTTGFFDDTYVDTSFNELLGGSIGSAVRTYIPDDDANIDDPLKSSVVDSVKVLIYSRAATNPILEPEHPARAFLEQSLLVRYVNLTDALFYNMDLELHPWPPMTFKGKVHCNYDIYLCSASGLDFYDTVTAAGKILHLYKPTLKQSHNGDVRFISDKDKDTFMSMRVDPEGTGNADKDWVYNREGDPDWFIESQKRWNGNVMDVAHGVQIRNPAGIADYKEDDYTTKSVNEMENHAYAVIEPLLPSGHTSRKSTAVRHQKFHARACLVFKVEVLPNSDPRCNDSVGGIYVTAYTWERKTNQNIPINSQMPFDDNRALDANDDPKKIPVYIPPGVIGAAKTSYPTPTPARSVDYYDSATSSVKSMDTYTYIPAGYDLIPEVFVQSGTPTNPYKSQKGVPVIGGFVDQRQKLDISPITLDVQRLREVIDERAHGTRTAAEMKDFWIDPADPLLKVTFDPKTQWNGVIYVEFPIVETAPRPADKIHCADVIGVGPKNLNLALQVVHGETIPNVPVATDGSVPDTSRYANPNPGFTIATNGPLYLIGNYNSDGQPTASADKPDDWKDAKGRVYLEPPAGIACDSFTALSKNWLRGAQDLDENGTRDGGGGWAENRIDSDGKIIVSTNRIRMADFTEMSVSVITGLIPTISFDSTGAKSGGAHNFPRFLEDWSDVDLRMRTSLNALFQSEAHTEPMPEVTDAIYDPPNRDWGQPDILEYPNHSRIPPGWIQVLDFRMGGIRNLTEAEYESIATGLR